MSKTENKPIDSGFDKPVEDPSDDLFNMNRQARALARYVRDNADQRPFTVAIFGDWGEGKTTLVRLLRYHLENPEGQIEKQLVNFVWFSAWPYDTTEKLWRALVLEIARVLYPQKNKETEARRSDAPAAAAPNESRVVNQPDGANAQTIVSHVIVEGADGEKKVAEVVEKTLPETENAEDADADEGLISKVSRFLAGDAFVLRKPPPVRDADAEYREIMQSLESTDYGQIRRHGAQLNEDAAMSAVLKGAVAALSTASPLVAGLSWLFGFEPKVNTDDLLKKKAEESQAKITSLQDFQNIFRKILEKRGNEEPVYIFVDDLDRARPDVALNIIESIRIALYDVRCVFIITIDQGHINQGLRVRSAEQYAAAAQGIPFADRGSEYIEKIIQFGVRVPSRTSEQVQRFIAAQYPEWTVAGDIIELIAGTNPRRIKQYCQHLTFQSLVGPLALSTARRRDTPAPVVEEAAASEAAALKKEDELPEFTATAVRRAMERLDETESEAIAFETGIELKDIGGTYDNRIREFVLSRVREGKLKQLIDVIQQQKPGILQEAMDKAGRQASELSE